MGEAVSQHLWEKYDDHSFKANSCDSWSDKLLVYHEKQNIWNSSGPENLGLRVAIEILFRGFQAEIFTTAFHLMILFCEIVEFQGRKFSNGVVGGNMLCI